MQLIQSLSDDCEVVLLGGAGEGPVWSVESGGHTYQVPPPRASIVDYTGFCPSVRALAVAIRSCDVFVGADSGPLHLAGTIGVPSVGLYSSFSHALRGVNLASVAPVEHPEACDKFVGGCKTHAQHGQPLPCGRENCAMMEAITPEEVDGQVRRLLHAGR